MILMNSILQEDHGNANLKITSSFMDINGALHLGNNSNDQIYEPISADIYDHTVSDDENEFFNDNDMIVDDCSYSPHHDRESSPINHSNVMTLNKKSINAESIFRLLNPHEVYF